MIVAAVAGLIITVIVAICTGAYLSLERTLFALLGLFLLLTLLIWVLLAVFLRKGQPITVSAPTAICDAPPVTRPGFRSGFSDAYLPANKREAEMLAKQWLKQAADCTKIINTTKKAATFFERYDFFLDTLERLAYCERWIRFTGELPSSKLSTADWDKKEQTRLFILRYAQETREKMYQLATPRGKLNKAEAYYNTLTEYSDRMDDENVLLFTQQYELLKQSV